MRRSHQMTTAFHGLSTGFLIQFAIGPVFFFIVNVSLQRTLSDGIVAAAAVTVVDYLYISLAILGIGKLLVKDKNKLLMGIFGSTVLTLFGVIMIASAFAKCGLQSSNVTAASSRLNSFLSAFLLTISNPMTILFWTGVFSSTAAEKGYQRGELWIFGIFAGLSTLVFLSAIAVVFSSMRTAVPNGIIFLSNCIVGSILAAYGVIRFAKLIRRAPLSSI
jgi:threonine/homoserine/homoserine lactone efflux protein